MHLPNVEGRVQAMVTKVCAVVEASELKKMAELSSFLGLVNYYANAYPT